MGYSPAGKTGIRVAAFRASSVPPRINNKATCIEHEEDTSRLDARFAFKVSVRQQVHICNHLHAVFPVILTVGFQNPFSMKIMVKRHIDGCPRHEVKQYIENGFT